ncbi:ATP-binding protein [Streptomyces laurentii]|uniref:ATP-binding protein n=1 Tax=Streptomyces laurentii TaxID=39478 RepID=UPI0033DA7464
MSNEPDKRTPAVGRYALDTSGTPPRADLVTRCTEDRTAIHRPDDGRGCCSPPTGTPNTLMLGGEAESVSHARKFADAYVREKSPAASGAHLDDVVLVTSELVTNSVRYGTEPGDQILIALHADDKRTRIEVHDPVRRTPRSQPESVERERGRGLFIVDAVCMGLWGCQDRPFGKFVWAEVPC